MSSLSSVMSAIYEINSKNQKNKRQTGPTKTALTHHPTFYSIMHQLSGLTTEKKNASILVCVFIFTHNTTSLTLCHENLASFSCFLLEWLLYNFHFFLSQTAYYAATQSEQHSYPHLGHNPPDEKQWRQVSGDSWFKVSELIAENDSKCTEHYSRRPKWAGKLLNWKRSISLSSGRLHDH